MLKQNLQFDRGFFSLSDGMRRGILPRLAQVGTTVGELVAPSEINKHMKILEKVL